MYVKFQKMLTIEEEDQIGLMLPDLKTYYKANIIKKDSYWYKCR